MSFTLSIERSVRLDPHSRPMKILLLTETLEPGGAETFVVRFANALSSAHDVKLVVLHSDKIHPALQSKVVQQVAVETLDLPGKALLWKLDSLFRTLGVGWSIVHGLLRRRLRKLVDQDPPDLIHSHLFHADWIASEIVRSSRPRPAHIFTVHGDYAAYFDGSADPRLPDFRQNAARIVAGADAIVGVAREHLDFFRQHFPASAGRLHLIYSGYSAPRTLNRNSSRQRLGLPDGKFLFGMVSRGVEKKGWREAIAAFRMLGRPEAALVLVGEGPEIDRIRREGLPEGVILAGFSPNPLDYIRHFDVGLLPTRFAHESLPTVVIEYLFCSKPIIATDVGEIHEMVVAPGGQPAGLLLDFCDGQIQTHELADNMGRLLEDRVLRSRLARAAKRAFTKFEMVRCVDDYTGVFRDAVSARRLGH